MTHKPTPWPPRLLDAISRLAALGEVAKREFFHDHIMIRRLDSLLNELVDLSRELRRESANRAKVAESGS